MTLAQIQDILDNTAYRVVEFAPGTYVLNGMLNIRRNQIVVRGNYANLSLANNTNEPNIFVGDRTNIVPPNTYSDITVENFVINGNKANQTQELSATFPHVYNNCIGISQCTDVLITGCDVSNARSGGIVWTVNCYNLTIQNCRSSNNFFDGIAGYTSNAVRLINCYCHSHSNGAGLSIDNNTQSLLVQGCTFTTAKEGIFARWTSNSQFIGNTITDNTLYGIFLSGYNLAPDDQGLTGCVFSNNVVANNTGSGIFLQGVQKTAFVGNTVTGNTGNGFNITSYGSTPSRGVAKYLILSGNSVSVNGDVGFYNDASNSAGNGAVSNFLQGNAIAGNVNGQVVGDVTAWTVNP